MRLLLALYPRAWRERYEAEFQAILEAQPLTPLVLLDVILGALDARLHPGLFSSSALTCQSAAAMGTGRGSLSWFAGPSRPTALSFAVLTPTVVFWIGIASWLLFKSEYLLSLLLDSPPNGPFVATAVALVCPVLSLALGLLGLEDRGGVGKVLTYLAVILSAASLIILGGYVCVDGIVSYAGGSLSFQS